MELRIYDKELNLLGIIENQKSLIWTRRYNKAGEFMAYFPLTDDNIRLIKIDNLISFRGANEAGVIEDVIMRSTNIERVIIASGRFLISYLDRRLIRPTYNFTGRTEIAMRQMIQNAVAIPLVEMGALQGFTDTIEFQATYKNLLSYESKLSVYSNIGFRFRPDFTNKKIYFETYRGLDRTRGQTERPFVEFSDRFDNLSSVENRKNTQLLKNVGYVGGEGEGSERVFITIGDDTLTGLERREMFVDARDISSMDITQAEYLEALRTRGYEKMNEQIFSDSYDVTTVPTGNYKYKDDYDLGDIVTIRKTDWNLTTNLRITEIQEVYEHGTATVIPTLGSPLPTKINWDEE